jgi:hypothetical protein
LDGVKGNFAVGESDYIATAIQEEARPIARLIHSNARGMIEQQQFFFQTLWGNSIPARQRFKEIEQGAKRDFVETIRDPYELQKLGSDLIKRAEEEILMLFSSAIDLSDQQKAGVLELLTEAASKHAVKIRILVPAADNVKRVTIIANEKIRELKELGIDIRKIKKEGKLDRLRKALTMMIVDQSVCLTAELEEDTKETSEETTGMGTYSNSESTVFAYTSIFEDLSMHSEIMQDDSAATGHKQPNKNNIKDQEESIIR